MRPNTWNQDFKMNSLPNQRSKYVNRFGAIIDTQDLKNIRAVNIKQTPKKERPLNKTYT